MTVISSSSHFKILLAVRRKTLVLSVASEVWFAWWTFRGMSYLMWLHFLETIVLKKSHQHIFSCRIPYRFLATKVSSWEVTGRISYGLCKLAHEESNLPHVRPFCSGSYSLADHEVYRFLTWPLPFLFLLTLSRFKQVGLRKERLTWYKYKRQLGRV